jgi:pimeloyl-ACP methyl ester carboxylesterase
MGAEAWYNSGNKTTVDNLDVFFKREGAGATLVCIHGFPTTSWDFEPVWPQLTARFDTIASDLIGLGQSAKPHQALTVSLQADIIEGLLLQQKITEAHLFAHDLGDTVAQELLARQYNHTAKVKWLSCVFMNGGIFPETHRPLFLQKLLLSPLGPILANLMTKRSLRQSLTKIFSAAHPPTDEFVDETWRLNMANDGVAMMPRLIKYMNERKEHRERWVAPLVNGVVPMRLINGEDDPISGKHAAERFVEMVPHADVVFLKNLGHYLHVENPEAVLQAFFEFHDKLPS